MYEIRWMLPLLGFLVACSSAKPPPAPDPSFRIDQNQPLLPEAQVKRLEARLSALEH
ncbi:MAG: hypothetical protein IVW51_16735 [Thermaceae bacterium]|nr:hypothetical protein [Thermaceae bacterium]